jgi:hypothetical protein
VERSSGGERSRHGNSEEEFDNDEDMCELEESMRCVCGALAHEHDQIDLEIIYTEAFLQLLQDESAIESVDADAPAQREYDGALP